MRKFVIPIFVFCLLFLLSPIRVGQYYDAGELAIRYVWIPFGGVNLIFYAMQPLLSPTSYRIFDGELNSVNNACSLITFSFIGGITTYFFFNKRTKKK